MNILESAEFSINCLLELNVSVLSRSAWLAREEDKCCGFLLFIIKKFTCFKFFEVVYYNKLYFILIYSEKIIIKNKTKIIMPELV